MRYLNCCFLGLLSLVAINGSGQSKSKAKKIENLISKCVDKAFNSCVYIIEFDTLKNCVKEGVDEANGFTGVVVTKEGHILTVSYAAVPNEVYRVTFPDGTRHIAIGCGRIGIQHKDVDFDMAMLKIVKPGKLPFAQMGRSSQLKIGQPVISISYPGAFFKQLPNVHFGRVTNAGFIGGYVESTTKMEPGDSGGPLFNELGQVIGIHSWIEKGEDQNHDVPIDSFLKYWSALNITKDYTELPQADQLPASSSPIAVQSVLPLDEVVQMPHGQNKCAVMISSKRGAQHLSIIGTIVGYVSATGANTYILSKNSMVGNDPVLKINGETVLTKVLSRDKSLDLVLLAASKKLEKGIPIKNDAINPDLKRKDYGRIMISALGSGTKKVGILSSGYTDVPMIDSYGWFGANATYIGQKITITDISEGGAAAQFLKLRDQVIQINGIPVIKPSYYGHELAKYFAGDLITVTVVRSGKIMHFAMFLPALPPIKHVSFEYPGGRSIRSDGFNHILVQDAAIKSGECGGPVFDINGKFYGINIARHSRTSTLIIPVGTLGQFINKSVITTEKKRFN